MKAYIRNGVVVGLYGSEIHAPTDCDTVELSGRKDIPQIGWLYNKAEDKFSAPALVVPETTIEEIRDAALKVIDAEAVQARIKVLGDNPTQLSIYTAKYQEAKAYKLKVLGTDASNYKWLSSEVSATGCAIDEAADRFISKYNEMLDVLTKIEELRIFAKAAIRSADTIDKIREVRKTTIPELRSV